MTASIQWLGHATFKLTLLDERVVIVDPWLDGNPSCPTSEYSQDRCDLILLTHGHFDHVGSLAQLLQQHQPTVVGTVELCTWLERQLGKGKFAPMNLGGTQDVEGVRVSLTQAFHSSSIDTPDGPVYAGMPAGLIVNVDGLPVIYHAGDTEVFSDMTLIKQIFQPEICLLPIGDHFTMGPKGAALAATFLQPDVIVPMHYKSFPVLEQSADNFINELPAELRDKVRELNAGDSMNWSD